MKIAVIGWGSLIWDRWRLGPGQKWLQGGPAVPVGWSSGPRPSLSIDLEKGREVPTHYVVSHRTKLDEVLNDFSDRDDPELASVAFVRGKDASERAKEPEYAALLSAIRTWCKENDVDAAVWRWGNEPAVTFH